MRKSTSRAEECGLSSFVSGDLGHLAIGSGGCLCLAGRVFAKSVKHPSLPNSDGYTVDHSSGLPYHSQLGLLEAGLVEKKNLVLINTYLEMTGAQDD